MTWTVAWRTWKGGVDEFSKPKLAIASEALLWIVEMRGILFSLVTCAMLSQAMAFGPAPFRNGSPLASGTDGTYQAVASGTNLTGIFSWVISGGVQLGGATNNNNGWIFFVDGDVVSGSTAVNVSDGKITGVLDPAADFQIPVDSSQTPILPFIKVLSNTVAQGRFNGSINLKSPTAAFSGTGNIEGTPARTYQVLFIDEPVPSTSAGVRTIPPVFQSTISVITSTTNATTGITTNTTTTADVLPFFQTPSSVAEVTRTNFNFRGTRLSPLTTPGLSAAGASTSSN
jgi:hypothetical protein